MCSTIILGRGADRVLAFNYDYSLGHGVVATNVRGAHKENGRTPGQRVLQWDVAHGSVTFNSFCLELPASGMNERGLCIAMMWHDDGSFGWDDAVPRLSPLQWIQYQLDTCATVADVVASLDRVGLRDEGICLHYIVLDASGASAVIELFGGHPRVVENPPFCALTNSSYEASLEAARAGNPRDEIAARTSLGRFETLHRLYADRADAGVDASAGMAALDAVEQGGVHAQAFPWTGDQRVTRTVWSVVFRPATRSFAFRSEGNRAVRTVALDRLGFEPADDYVLMDVHEGAGGDVAHLFEPYTIDANRRLVEQSAAVIPLPGDERENLIRIVDELYRTREMTLFSDATPGA